jgi:hypothetical protein
MNDTRAMMGATSELRRNLCEFPAMFAKAVVVHAAKEYHTATATLIDLGCGPLAVTCAHVIRQYLKQWRGGQAVLRIGNVRVLASQLCSIGEDVDLATIRLTDEQAAELVGEDGIATQFYTPTRWPPDPAKAGEWAAIGGFPAPWRIKRSESREMRFHYYGIGATSVTSASARQFGCRFEREHWIWITHPGELPDLTTLGGLSGGPVFVERHLHRELVGIVSDFRDDWDIMLMPHAHWICRDGSIREA